MRDCITSRDNPHIKQLMALLTQKKQRDETGLFALEGVRLCLDAVDAGVTPERLLLTQEAALRNDALMRLAESGVKTIWIDANLAARIGDTRSPQGMFLVAPKPDNLSKPLAATGRYLLLAGLQDPGNLGTMLRTALALGVDGALLANCPDPYSPKVVRAAMGALWRLPITLCPDDADMVCGVREAGIKVFAAALTADAVTVSGAGLGKGCAVLIGNEGAGLPDKLVGACDKSVMIPMHSGADSLNAAAAASILLWEMTKN